MLRGLLQAECRAGALSMLSTPSPDYVFIVLVSICISKTHLERHLSVVVLVYVPDCCLKPNIEFQTDQSHSAKL